MATATVPVDPVLPAWTDSNGHVFLVQDMAPATGPDLGPDSTRMTGVTVNCHPDACRLLNHTGTYEVIADFDEINAGRIFGWTRSPDCDATLAQAIARYTAPTDNLALNPPRQAGR